MKEFVTIQIQCEAGKWTIEALQGSYVLFKAECWSYKRVIQLLDSMSNEFKSLNPHSPDT